MILWADFKFIAVADMFLCFPFLGTLASGIWPLAQDTKTLFEPMMAFMGHKVGDDEIDDQSEKYMESTENSSERDRHLDSSEVAVEENDAAEGNAKMDSQTTEFVQEESSEKKSVFETDVLLAATSLNLEREIPSDQMPSEDSNSLEPKEVEVSASQTVEIVPKNINTEENDRVVSSEVVNIYSSSLDQSSSNETENDFGGSVSINQNSFVVAESGSVKVQSEAGDIRVPETKETEVVGAESKVKKLEKEIKTMEAALLGAARQSQVHCLLQSDFLFIGSVLCHAFPFDFT